MAEEPGRRKIGCWVSHYIIIIIIIIITITINNKQRVSTSKAPSTGVT